MTQPTSSASHHVAIIGGGPAGLMAAEVLSQAGVHVDLYDSLPSVGRKFLLAGVGGMNITHSEAYPALVLSLPVMAPLAWALAPSSFTSIGTPAWIGLGYVSTGIATTSKTISA